MTRRDEFESDGGVGYCRDNIGAVIGRMLVKRKRMMVRMSGMAMLLLDTFAQGRFVVMVRNGAMGENDKKSRQSHVCSEGRKHFKKYINIQF